MGKFPFFRIMEKFPFVRVTGKLPFVRRAQAYCFKDMMIIVPLARTRDGVGKCMEIVHAVPLISTKGIGERVLASLQECEDDVPDDYSRSNLGHGALAILREAKCRSWRSFHNRAALVQVKDLKGMKLEVTPTRRSGGASYDIIEKKRICRADAEAVGQTIQQAISDCE